MKQVGATNTFIRTPFLCEGILEGTLAGLVAMALLMLWIGDIVRRRMRRDSDGD